MEATSDRRSFFQSPRNQRRLLWAALVVFALGVMAVTFALFRNTGDATETFSNKPADVFTPEETTAIDPAARQVAGEFIKTAVARKNLPASYDIVAPELRQGLTRQQWETGSIPIVFYPAGNIELVTFKVDRSYKNEVHWQVYMVPKAGSEEQPALFYIGLKRANEQAPWKVFEWVPSYKPALPDPG